MIYFSYTLAVLGYAALAALISWLLVWGAAILTPFGGLVLAGIIFFGALLIHELSWYRRYRRHFSQSKPDADYLVCIHEISKIHQSLVEAWSKLGVEIDKRSFTADLQEVAALLSASTQNMSPQRFITIVTKQLQSFEKMIRLGIKNSNELQHRHLQKTEGAAVESIPLYPRISLSPRVSGNTVLHATESLEPRLSLAPLPENSQTLAAAPAPPLSPPRPETQLIEVIEHMLKQDHIPIKKYTISRTAAKLPEIIGYGVNIVEAIRPEVWHHPRIVRLRPFLDNALLIQALQIIREQSKHSPHLRFAIDVGTASLLNNDFINNILDFSTTYPEISTRLIFVIDDWDFNAQSTAIESVMAQLYRAKINWAIRQTVFSDITPQPPRLVKLWITAPTVTQYLFTHGAPNLVTQWSQALGQQNVTLVLAGIHGPEQIAWAGQSQKVLHQVA